MPLKLITAPPVLPVTVAEAKRAIRAEEFDDDDTYIEALIRVATDYLDGPNGILQRALVQQTWDLYLDSFPSNEIRIPLSPLREVVHIKYDDDNGDEQTVSTADYTVDTIRQPGWVLPSQEASWPTTFNGVNAVRVRFTAGYEPSSDSPSDLTAGVPPQIKQWILLNVGLHYAQREPIAVGTVAANLSWIADALIERLKVYV